MCNSKKKQIFQGKKKIGLHILKIRNYGLELKKVESDYKTLTLENTSRYSSFMQLFKKEKQNSFSLLKHYHTL